MQRNDTPWIASSQSQGSEHDGTKLRKRNDDRREGHRKGKRRFGIDREADSDEREA